MISYRTLFKQCVNILATVISACLLYDDLCLFFSKPTYSSKFNIKLQSRHLPDFFICPIPAFDQLELQKHGYKTSYNFMKGQIRYTKASFKSWIGNSSDADETTLDDISLIKSVKDCPRFFVMFEEKIKHTFASFTLTTPVFPHGRCCKVFLHKNQTNSPIVRVGIVVKLNKNNTLLKGFRLFLSSKEESHHLKLGNCNKNGIDMKAILNETGMKYYSVKILEEFDLQEDPKVSCKNYDNRYGYGKV